MALCACFCTHTITCVSFREMEKQSTIPCTPDRHLLYTKWTQICVEFLSYSNSTFVFQITKSEGRIGERKPWGSYTEYEYFLNNPMLLVYKTLGFTKWRKHIIMERAWLLGQTYLSWHSSLALTSCATLGKLLRSLRASLLIIKMEMVRMLVSKITEM